MLRGSDRPVQYRNLRPTRANCRYWRIQVNTQFPNYLGIETSLTRDSDPSKTDKMLCPYRRDPCDTLNKSPLAACLKSPCACEFTGITPPCAAMRVRSKHLDSTNDQYPRRSCASAPINNSRATSPPNTDKQITQSPKTTRCYFGSEASTSGLARRGWGIDRIRRDRSSKIFMNTI